METAFLTCTESEIHPEYKKRCEIQLHNALLTAAFTGKMACGIKNIFIEQMQQYAQDCLDFPIQNVGCSRILLNVGWPSSCTL